MSSSADDDLVIDEDLDDDPVELAYRQWSTLAWRLGASGADLDPAELAAVLASVHEDEWPGLVNMHIGANAGTALHQACRARNLAAVKWLVVEAHANMQEVTHDDRTPLHEACFSGSLDVVRLLVQQGADLEAREDEVRTPLHYVCWYCGNADIVRYLVHEAGADVQAADETDCTPFMLACSSGNWACAVELAADGLTPTELVALHRTLPRATSEQFEPSVFAQLVATCDMFPPGVPPATAKLDAAAAAVIQLLAGCAQGVNSTHVLQRVVGPTPAHRAT